MALRLQSRGQPLLSAHEETRSWRHDRVFSFLAHSRHGGSRGDGIGGGHEGCWNDEGKKSVSTLHALTIVRLEAHTRCVESEFRTLATAERTAHGGGEDGVMMRRMRPWRWQIC